MCLKIIQCVICGSKFGKGTGFPKWYNSKYQICCSEDCYDFYVELYDEDNSLDQFSSSEDE